MNKETFTIRVRKNIPAIPAFFFYFTLLAAVTFMIFLSIREPGQTSTFTPDYRILSITYWLDPFACQIITGLLVIWIIYSYYVTPSMQKRRKIITFAFSTFVPIGIMFLELLMEKFWLKPAFNYDRPPMPFKIPEPPLTDLFENMLLGGSDTIGTSTPSGFAMRQLLLFLLGTNFAILLLKPVCCNQREPSEKVEPRLSRALKQLKESLKKAKKFCLINAQNLVIIIALFILTTIILFSRVYRVRHTIFDIGIAFGVAVYLFWLVYTILVTLFDIRARHFLTDMTGASFIFIPLFFFYSRSAKEWTLASIIIFTILGLVHYVSPIIKTNLSQNQEE